MSLEHEDPDAEVPPLMSVPRWYNPAIITLGLAGFATYIVTQGRFDWVMAIALIAGIALFLFLWWVQRRLNKGNSPIDRRATYSSSTVFGAIWVALGIVQAALIDQYVLGGFMILFGVITLAAFGPPLLRERAARRAADAEAGEQR
ncbi:hypothetical protein [Microbacterium sp. SLBN-146]|uniref:hypothetical protein n=1 Tax=Microbacterium sp. SLBN-146 TaxID=2768457 RepID=UPI00115015F6|nr:hypothetical protein [Microbacterium sp. SLBN-146]TQJ32644.1 hypothetical protein FBY39_3158 [Microbacterium sp. SLBN-146]